VARGKIFLVSVDIKGKDTDGRASHIPVLFFWLAVTV